MAPSLAHRLVTGDLSVMVRPTSDKSSWVFRPTGTRAVICPRHPLTWGVRCKRRSEASKACSDLPTSGAYSHQFSAASVPHQLLIGYGSIPLSRTFGQRPSGLRARHDRHEIRHTQATPICLERGSSSRIREPRTEADGHVARGARTAATDHGKHRAPRRARTGRPDSGRRPSPSHVQREVRSRECPHSTRLRSALPIPTRSWWSRRGPWHPR